MKEHLVGWVDPVKINDIKMLGSLTLNPTYKEKTDYFTNNYRDTTLALVANVPVVLTVQ